jgi:ABC-type nitrate/sulfonate/bicarbonate transport system permease component
MFAAEIVRSQAGLGFLITHAEASVRFDIILATIVVSASLGFASDRLLLIVRRRVLRGQLIGKQEVQI